MLKKNYEPYSNSEFTLTHNETLTLSILKYLNDETTLVRECYFNNEIKGFKYESSDISSPGDYFFVVYLDGEAVPCGNCHLKIKDDANLISVKNTRVFLKNGDTFLQFLSDLLLHLFALFIKLIDKLVLLLNNEK